MYGVNPVLEALRAHPDEVLRVLLERGKDGRRSQGGERVAAAAEQSGVRIEDAQAGDLSRRSNGGVHQGAGAELAEFRYLELSDLIEAARATDRPPLFLLLDGVTDPQNLGALIRSAYALGAHGVVLPKDRAVGVTSAAFKAAAGALEHCPIARVTNLVRAIEELKQALVWTVALAGDGEQRLDRIDLTSAIALVMGNESSGVRPLVRKSCDHVAHIPMAGGLGSLNVSAAGAVALYEVARQRRG